MFLVFGVEEKGASWLNLKYTATNVLFVPNQLLLLCVVRKTMCFCASFVNLQLHAPWTNWINVYFFAFEKCNVIKRKTFELHFNTSFVTQYSSCSTFCWLHIVCEDHIMILKWFCFA